MVQSRISGHQNRHSKITATYLHCIYNEEILAEYKYGLSKEDSFLVTGNLKHFPKKPFIVSPAEMIQIIHEMQYPKSGLLSEPAAQYGTKGFI